MVTHDSFVSQKLKIDHRHNLEFYDGNFRFLENSLKWTIPIIYEYLRNQTDAQKLKIDHRHNLEF